MCGNSSNTASEVYKYCCVGLCVTNVTQNTLFTIESLVNYNEKPSVIESMLHLDLDCVCTIVHNNIHMTPSFNAIESCGVRERSNIPTSELILVLHH